MAYGYLSNQKGNRLGTVRLQRGIRSLDNQALSRQVMTATSDRLTSTPKRPLREAHYNR